MGIITDIFTGCEEKSRLYDPVREPYIGENGHGNGS